MLGPHRHIFHIIFIWHCFPLSIKLTALHMFWTQDGLFQCFHNPLNTNKDVMGVCGLSHCSADSSGLHGYPRHQALCCSLFQTQGISHLQIFQLSNTVLHPYLSVQCACECVCVCVCACVRACACMCVLLCMHVWASCTVTLEPLLTCDVRNLTRDVFLYVLAFVKLWITFSILMYIMCVTFVQCFGLWGRHFYEFPLLLLSAIFMFNIIFEHM